MNTLEKLKKYNLFYDLLETPLNEMRLLVFHEANGYCYYLGYKLNSHSVDCNNVINNDKQSEILINVKIENETKQAILYVNKIHCIKREDLSKFIDLNLVNVKKQLPIVCQGKLIQSLISIFNSANNYPNCYIIKVGINEAGDAGFVADLVYCHETLWQNLIKQKLFYNFEKIAYLRHKLAAHNQDLKFVGCLNEDFLASNNNSEIDLIFGGLWTLCNCLSIAPVLKNWKFCDHFNDSEARINQISAKI